VFVDGISTPKWWVTGGSPDNSDGTW
jgi:hypothetical protein